MWQSRKLRLAAPLVLGALVLAGSQIPAYAAAVVYTAHLSGPAESPPNASPGPGSPQVTLALAPHTMRAQPQFSGLTTGTIASHTHACTASPGTGTASVATTTP